MERLRVLRRVVRKGRRLADEREFLLVEMLVEPKDGKQVAPLGAQRAVTLVVSLDPLTAET